MFWGFVYKDLMISGAFYEMIFARNGIRARD
jgi:hypothetical protein